MRNAVRNDRQVRIVTVEREDRDRWLCIHGIERANASGDFTLRRHVPDETKPSPVDGPDQPLRLPVVTKQLPRALDPAGNRAVANRSATPDRGYQLILADKTFAVLDEQKQQGKDLRLGGKQAVILAQFKLAQVQDMLADTVSHGARP